MTAPAVSPGVTRDRGVAALVGVTALAFVVLFSDPMRSIGAAWWSDPEAGHGLLLAPVACWLAYRAGVLPVAEPKVMLGSSLVAVGVMVRIVSALAAEAFGGRLALLLVLAGLVVAAWGTRQLMAWWLPAVLLSLAMPLPEIVVASLALPLQFEASRLGAALLETRGIPVRLDGNVIRLPGRELFVTEACSGLRSLTALLSLGVLLGGLRLRRPVMRVVLVVLTLPIAVAINGIRVFLTGFLALFVNPSSAEGFTHLTQGWLMFVVAFALLAGVASLLSRLENRRAPGAVRA
jgi:exosortase